MMAYRRLLMSTSSNTPCFAAFPTSGAVVRTGTRPGTTRSFNVSFSSVCLRQSTSFIPCKLRVLPNVQHLRVLVPPVVSGHGRLMTTSMSNKTDTGTGTGTETGTGTHTSSAAKPDVLTLLYDGDCPLCMKEVNMLRRRSDARGGTLGFVDIADVGYEDMGFGIDYKSAMGEIHAVRGDGSVVTGVQVFKEAYEAVGLGWVYAVLKVPGAGWTADKAYKVWADNRLAFTGRDSLEAIIRAREEKRTCK